MKVLLLQDVNKVGSLGDEIEVKPGFARNFLLKSKLAIAINEGNKNIVETYKKRLGGKRQKSISENKDIADKINQLDLTYIVKASKEGTLFGAINKNNIINLLAENDIKLGEKQTLNSEHIKKLGSYIIPINLHSEVKANLKLKIVAEKAAVAPAKVEAVEDKPKKTTRKSASKKATEAVESQEEETAVEKSAKKVAEAAEPKKDEAVKEKPAKKAAEKKN